MKSRLLILTGILLSLSLHLFAYSYQKVVTTTTSDYKIIHYTESSVPWDIYVMELDLTQNGLQLKTGLANDMVAFTYSNGEHSVQKETVAQMIGRRRTAGENVLGGINADFFDMTTGRQFNVTATGGRIASTGITSTHHAALYTDENGTPYINLVNMQHTMSIGPDNYNINSVNEIRRQDHLVIYNHFNGLQTSFANIWGTELLLEPQSEPHMNGTVEYKVIAKAANVTRTSIHQIIASGHGTAVTYLNKAKAGDIIQISTSFAGVGNEKIYEMIGGWGHIVAGGVNRAVNSIVEEGSMLHENDRHPRSAVGYNQDKTKLYLVAIDGRSTISRGMNLGEVADFMIDELGVWDGLNFDGGGSTTLMAGNQTINNLSDGAQRRIANALLVTKQGATDVNEIYGKDEISIFPNPATELINIELKGDNYGDLYFEMYSLDGRLVSSKTLQGIQQGDKRYQIPLKDLQPGVYLYKLNSRGNALGSGKIMIQ